MLNLVNSYLITTSFFNSSLSPYPRTITMIFNFIVGDLGLIMILFAFGLIIFKSNKGKFIYLMVTTIILTIMCLANTMFFYQYGMFFSFTNLQAFNNPTGGQAFAFMISVMGILLLNAQYLALMPLVVIVTLFSIFRKKKNICFYDDVKNRYTIHIIVGIIIIFIGGAFMHHAQRIYRYEIQETWYQDNHDVLYGIQNIGMYNFYVYDFYLEFISNIEEINEEKMNEIRDYLATKENPFRPSLIDGNIYGNNTELNGVYDGMNLLLIQAESLNNFVIGLRVNGKEITPNLNQLAQNGIYFNNFYSNVGIGNTSDAEFSVMTGLYPTGPELMVYQYGKGNYETLAKDFNAKNYYTVSTHGNTKYFYNRFETHTQTYGFDDHFGFEDLFIDDSIIHNWISDESLLRQTIDIMANQNKPSFAYPLLVSCHTPYLDDEYMQSVLSMLGFSLDSDISNPFVRGYLEHAFYVDYAIGQAILYLEESGLKENTVIALYGDHGAGLNESHFIEHFNLFENEMNPFPLALNNLLDPNNKFAFRKLSQEVPFIIYELSDTKKITPQTISLVRSEVDIYRTMSNLFGLESKYYFGVDALSGEPTIAYNPRNLDTFTDLFMLSTTSQEAYTNPFVFINPQQINYMSDIVRSIKDRNDKLLLYILYNLQE